MSPSGTPSSATKSPRAPRWTLSGRDGSASAPSSCLCCAAVSKTRDNQQENQESNMNSNFELNNLVGRELTDEELTMIQGGGILSSIGHAFSSGVSALGSAISSGASAVGHVIGLGAQAISNGFLNQAL